MIVIFNNNFVKINSQTKTTYMGYDIETEQFHTIPKEKCTPIPNIILRLIESEELRFKVVDTLTKGNKEEASNMLNVSVRTVGRMEEFYSQKIINKK